MCAFLIFRRKNSGSLLKSRGICDIIVPSYQEWRRDWPCEARQPGCKRMYGAKSRQMRVIPHPCALGLPGAFSVV